MPWCNLVDASFDTLSFSAVVFFQRRIWQPRVSLSQSTTVSWLILVMILPRCFRNMNRLGCETPTRRQSAAWKLSTSLLVRSWLFATDVWKRLRSNFITCKFQPCYLYSQIPLLWKFHVIQLPLSSSTCKFHRVTFTAKFHYLQIQRPLYWHPTSNFPDSRAASFSSKYIVGLILRWTGKIHSDIWPIPPLNFIGSQKVWNSASVFLTPAVWELWKNNWGVGKYGVRRCRRRENGVWVGGGAVEGAVPPPQKMF